MDDVETITNLSRKIVTLENNRRERIATAVMQGLVAADTYKSWCDLALDSIRAADALIAELEKEKGWFNDTGRTERD